MSEEEQGEMIISAGSRIEGKVEYSGTIVVSGSISGEVNCGIFVVLKEGIIDGIVNCVSQTKKVKSKLKPVKLLGSVSTEFDSMRTNLLISLLETLKFNLKNENAESIFEIGTIFQHDDSAETNVSEQQNLSVMISSSDANFTSIKQALSTLMNLLGLKYSLKENKNESFIEGRSGEIIFNKQKIGLIGEINPQVVLNFDLKNPCAYFELNLDSLLNEF